MAVEKKIVDFLELFGYSVVRMCFQVGKGSLAGAGVVSLRGLVGVTSALTSQRQTKQRLQKVKTYSYYMALFVSSAPLLHFFFIIYGNYHKQPFIASIGFLYIFYNAMKYLCLVFLK